VKLDDDTPRILIHTGWATHNIGDIGHTPGILRYLTEHLPGTRLFCWIVRTNDAVSAMLRRRFPDVTFVQGTLDATGTASTAELQTAFDAANLVILGSGMLFTRFYKPPFGILQACLAHEKPFGLYGQSFDGFRDEDAELLPRLFARAGFIFCRDTESLKFLREVGVTPDVLEFGPDACFGVDIRDDARTAAFLHENELLPRRYLAVILRTDKEVSVNRSEREADEASESVAPGPEQWSAKLREIIVDWVRRTGNKVAIVPEVEKEIGPGRTLLWERLPEEIRPFVVHRDCFWNVDEAAAFYAQAHTVVALEPHSCILALAQGTPAIHLFTARHGYKAWMFRDIGLPEWLINVDTEPAERVTATLKRIEAQYPLAQAKVRRAMDFVEGRTAEMMRDVRRTIRTIPNFGVSDE
jgi:polysaccharide pyruvyl transferase WcaK-like protein